MGSTMVHWILKGKCSRSVRVKVHRFRRNLFSFSVCEGSLRVEDAYVPTPRCTPYILGV